MNKISNSFLLIAISLLFFSSCQNEAVTPLSGKELFKKYYEGPYPNEVVELKEGVASQNIQEEVFKLYEQGRFENTMILFDELQKEAKGMNFMAYFYKAQSNIALLYYQNALGEFSKIPKDDPYYDRAQWYIGLSYLAQEMVPEAKIVLGRIAKNDKDVYKKKEAKEILSQLK
jgi:tetratricopeptide (TPR) repeat protein